MRIEFQEKITPEKLNKEINGMFKKSDTTYSRIILMCIVVVIYMLFKEASSIINLEFQSVSRVALFTIFFGVFYIILLMRIKSKRKNDFQKRCQIILDKMTSKREFIHISISDEKLILEHPMHTREYSWNYFTTFQNTTSMFHFNFGSTPFDRIGIFKKDMSKSDLEKLEDFLVEKFH